ncbi:MAG: hypothetical protein AAGC97_19505 [Planctomycetota bacterium]
MVVTLEWLADQGIRAADFQHRRRRLPDAQAGFATPDADIS